jgi:hypothetical protein
MFNSFTHFRFGSSVNYTLHQDHVLLTAIVKLQSFNGCCWCEGSVPAGDLYQLPFAFAKEVCLLSFNVTKT